MGQAHGVEEHLAQLLGAVGVEAGAARLHVDAGEDVFQLRAHLHAELLDALFVHEDADAGHVGQHLRQRELDVVVEESSSSAVISAFILANRSASAPASGHFSQVKAASAR